MAHLSIGELSQRAQVKIPTIRYYEDIGLLPEPERTASNRRIYSAKSLRRLAFIRRSRELGFDLPAIRQLQTLLQNPEQPCNEAHALAELRLQDVNDKITQLQDLKKELELMLQEHDHDHVEDCHVLGSLRQSAKSTRRRTEA